MWSANQCRADNVGGRGLLRDMGGGDSLVAEARHTRPCAGYPRRQKRRGFVDFLPAKAKITFICPWRVLRAGMTSRSALDRYWAIPSCVAGAPSLRAQRSNPGANAR